MHDWRKETLCLWLSGFLGMKIDRIVFEGNYKYLNSLARITFKIMRRYVDICLLI